MSRGDCRIMITRDSMEVGQMVNREVDQDRKNEAYRLRLAGKTYRDIGRLMGIGHGTAERWCKEYMETVTLPLVDEIRKQEVDRLLRYLERLDERVDEGDDKAISLAIKISERLCKMLGADMPTVTVNETVAVSQLDLDIRGLIDQQNARNAVAKSIAAQKGIGTGESNA
jgi:transposase